MPAARGASLFRRAGPALSRSRWGLPALAAAAWLLAGLVCAEELHAALLRHEAGEDLRPLYLAGRAVLHGKDIYRVHFFVYPPTAAVASVPLTLLRFRSLIGLDLVAGLLAVALLAWASARLLLGRSRTRRARLTMLAVTGLAVAAVVASRTAYHALPLGNISLLLAPAAVAVAVLAGRRQWHGSCLLLALTLLLKPLLLPLVLVPVLARRWRPLLLAGGAAALLLALSLPFTAGLNRIPSVIRLLARGSVLVGRTAPDNLSLAGLARVHPGWFPPGLLTAGRLAVAGAAVWICLRLWRRRHRPDSRAAIAAGSMLLLATFLAGPLSEVHYLFAVLPGAAAAVALTGRRTVRGLSAAGLLAILPPLHHLPAGQEQVLQVLAELAWYAATVLALHEWSRSRGTATAAAGRPVPSAPGLPRQPDAPDLERSRPLRRAAVRG